MKKIPPPIRTRIYRTDTVTEVKARVGLKLLYKSTSALMLDRVEILPLLLNLVVVFQFGICLHHFVPVFFKRREYLFKKYGINPLVLIVGTYRNQKHVHNIALVLQRL